MEVEQEGSYRMEPLEAFAENARRLRRERDLTRERLAELSAFRAGAERAPSGTKRETALTRRAGSPWARVVSNHRPLACEASALPLSYAPSVWRRLYAGPAVGGDARRPPGPGR